MSRERLRFDGLLADQDQRPQRNPDPYLQAWS
jgi:hypothetical protein